MTNRLPWELFPPGLTLFFGFAAMAANQYHTLLLETVHGFTAQEIGTTVMFGASTQIFLPWIILRLGNRWLRTDQILRASYLFMALFLIALPRVQSGYAAMFTYFALMISLNVCAVLQITSIIAVTRKKGDTWFFILRSGGTLGFATLCLVSSQLAKFMELKQLYLIFAAFSLAAYFSSFQTSHDNAPAKVRLQVRQVALELRKGSTPTLIGCMALANMAVFGAVSIIGNHMHHELTASPAQISKAWTIATFSEIPLIWLAILFMRRYGLKALMLTGLCTSTLRMLLIWQITDLHWFYATQVFHGLFFGATLSGIGIHLAHMYGTKSLHGMQMVSQLLYGGIATSLGGLASGWIWANFGLRSVYLVAFLCLLVATIWFTISYREPASIAEGAGNEKTI